MDYKHLLTAEITKIYQSLSDPKNPYHLNNPSLLSGKSGIALFLMHYARMANDSDAKELANRYLDELLVNADRISDFSLGSGLLGVNWLFQHLSENNLIDYEIDLSEINELSETMVEKYKARDNYDAFFGVIGIGNFYLSQKQISEAGVRIISSVVDALQAISKEDEKGIYWNNYFSVKRTNPDQIARDFGLAHGIPSIIVFLVRVYKRGIHHKDLKNTIEKSTLWLLSKEGNYGLGRFPNKTIDSEIKGLNRVAWCYGDLSIGIAVQQAADVCQNQLLQSKATEILLRCAKRELADSAVFHFLNENYVDAGFCHGSVGNAYIFWRLWKKYGHSYFFDSYEYWLELTFKYLSDRPLGGYAKLLLDEEFPQCELITGLLDGPAGIGLCYISLLENHQDDSEWETIFSI